MDETARRPRARARRAPAEATRHHVASAGAPSPRYRTYGPYARDEYGITCTKEWEKRWRAQSVRVACLDRARLDGAFPRFHGVLCDGTVGHSSDFVGETKTRYYEHT